MAERIITGIANFDDLVFGGLPIGDTILVSGNAGCGKTIFCIQTLYNNAKQGKKCLHITFEQEVDNLKRELKSFNIDLEEVKDNLKLVDIDVIDPNSLLRIMTELEKEEYDLVCIDSLPAFTACSVDNKRDFSMKEVLETVYPVPVSEDGLARQKVLHLLNTLKKSKATILIISEVVEGEKGLSRDTYSEFLSDGIIKMDYIELGQDVIRTLKIRKMRHSKHLKEPRNYTIEEGKGIVVEKNS